MAKKRSKRTSEATGGHQKDSQSIKKKTRFGVLRFSPHKSFRRTYREDCRREIKAPGVAQHIYMSFKYLFSNWKVFVPFVVLMTVVGVLTIGTEGILDEMTEVFAGLIFLVIWLTTLFLLRHIMAGNKIKLREGLYNAMSPLVSTLVVFLVILIECIPIFLLLIAYAAAVKTDFLTTPFYALLFFVFAMVMVLISGYLLASSLMALIIVSVPGTYPLVAISKAAELVMGCRMRLTLRLVGLILVLGVIWAVILWPIVILRAPTWVLSIVAMAVGCFSAMYATTYLYLYYRWLIEVD